MRRFEAGGENSDSAVKGERPVYFSETSDYVVCRVYDRYRLLAGNRLHGPAIVEELDSTVVIHPDYHAEVDLHGNLIIQE